MQDSERFFVCVMPCPVGGVALMPGFAQVTSPGVAAVETLLHELGHNLSLAHAPCGEPGGVDQGSPYEGGVPGLPGFDAADEAWVPATSFDVMGCCVGSWLSEVLARSEAHLVEVDHVETRVFSARVGVTEATGLAAHTVRVAYEEAWASRRVVDLD